MRNKRANPITHTYSGLPIKYGWHEPQSSRFKLSLFKFQSPMNCRVPQPCYIGKLPMEILSRIFMLAAHGTPSEFPQSVTLPHALASVDLRWRTVVLCNHGLWSRLVIDLKKVIRNQTSEGLTPLTTMITRSGRSPCHLRRLFTAGVVCALAYRHTYTPI